MADSDLVQELNERLVGILFKIPAKSRSGKICYSGNFIDLNVLFILIKDKPVYPVKLT